MIYRWIWDLVEEIFSRVPSTSLRAVRSTCKLWNLLFKDPRFTKKHLGKEILVTMVCDFRVCVMRVSLQGAYNHKDGLLDLSIKQLGQLNELKIGQVFHCDGLLLCIPKAAAVRPVIVVWNPYLWQVKQIQPRNKYTIFDRYDIGNDNNNNPKILRCFDPYDLGDYNKNVEYEIYDFKSNSWRVLDVTPDWYVPYYHCRGVYLKGNIYFVAQERLKEREVVIEQFLLCFDFTRERFGLRILLPLLIHSRSADYVILSAVRVTQLAMLFHCVDTNEMEIRITTKIEHNAVSWSSFLRVDMTPGRFHFKYGSFFVDEKKKVVVVFGNDRKMSRYNKAYVIGEDGYYKEVDLGLGESYCWPSVCPYVPSSMQIQQDLRSIGKRKERDY